MWRVPAKTAVHQRCPRCLVINQNESAWQRARELINTRVREVLAIKKERGRSLCGAQEPDRATSLAPANEGLYWSSSSLAARVQNTKPLVRFLSQPTTPVLPVTA